MTTRTLFVTGTDTDVGKTFVSAAILSKLASHGYKTAGFKPISAGCEDTPEGLRNEDALVLQQASSVSLSYAEVNPVAFRDPVAPHLAAAREKVALSVEGLKKAIAHLHSKHPDILLVEGAGGWRLPLGGGRFLSQLPQELDMSVIMVVGMKLGCLNHAILTSEAIKADGLKTIGWVANFIDQDMLYARENLVSLKEMIDAPCLGEVPFLHDPLQAAPHLDVSSLLS